MRILSTATAAPTIGVGPRLRGPRRVAEDALAAATRSTCAAPSTGPLVADRAARRSASEVAARDLDAYDVVHVDTYRAGRRRRRRAAPPASRW